MATVHTTPIRVRSVIQSALEVRERRMSTPTPATPTPLPIFPDSITSTTTTASLSPPLTQRFAVLEGSGVREPPPEVKFGWTPPLLPVESPVSGVVACGVDARMAALRQRARQRQEELGLESAASVATASRNQEEEEEEEEEEEGVEFVGGDGDDDDDDDEAEEDGVVGSMLEEQKDIDDSMMSEPLELDVDEAGLVTVGAVGDDDGDGSTVPPPLVDTTALEAVSAPVDDRPPTSRRRRSLAPTHTASTTTAAPQMTPFQHDWSVRSDRAGAGCRCRGGPLTRPMPTTLHHPHESPYRSSVPTAGPSTAATGAVRLPLRATLPVEARWSQTEVRSLLKDIRDTQDTLKCILHMNSPRHPHKSRSSRWHPSSTHPTGPFY